MIITRWFGTAALAALLAMTAFAATEDLESADSALIKALNRRDFAQAAGRLHSQCISFGVSDERPADLEGVSPGERAERLRSLLAPYRDWSLQSEGEPVYRVVGDVGIVSGVERVSRQRENRAPEMVRQRFTRTWHLADGKWLLVASHRSDFAGEALARFPLPESDAERRIIEIAEAAPRFANVSLSDARVLRMLAEFSGAKLVLEFGASTGYSGLWIANGLRKTGGKLITYELDPKRAQIARENFKNAGLDGVVTLVEGDAHKEVTKVKGPVDMVFIDAEKEGYKQYLEQVLPLVRPGGMVIGHNMRFPTPHANFVEAITSNPALDTVFIHMHDRGMSLTLKKR